MKEFCPNKASKEFKELASIFGEDKAYFLWMRNKGNELDKAPNGAESKLFKTLLDEFNGDRVEALKAKAKVYSNDFLNWFGDWVNLFDNLNIYQEKYLDFENSGRTYVGKSGKSIPIMINKGVKYAKAPERTTPTKEDPFGFNSVYVDKTIVVGLEIDQDRPFDGICLLTSQACQNFLKNRYGIKSNIAIIYAKSPVKDEIINHWVTVLSIDGKAYIYDMPLTEYILRTNPFVINGKTYYEGVIKQKYTPRLIKVTKENLSKYYEDNNENDLQIEVIKDIADELTRDGNSASVENLIYRPVYGIPSKVVDENGEPLVVWHGGARDIKIFRNGSNGSTTETGYYTDEKTGEKIPTDANRAMFFSSNKHVATSYALLYANGIYKTLFNRTQSLISTFYGGKASISHNYFKSLDDLYKFLEDVSEFNPRFAKLKDYIKTLLRENKRMPENAVNAARDLFVKLRSELREYENGNNLVSSQWDDALEKGKNIIEKYNTDSGIDKLMSGEIPAQLKKEYELSQKLQQYRIKNGKVKNGFLETAIAWLSSRSDYINGDYRLIYDGKTLLFDYTKNPDEKREIPISKMSKEEILKFFDNALIYNKQSVAERNEDAVKQKYQEKSQRYPVFLNIKNPLVHDYEGTHQGQGYKESNKYPFGYIAARQVNKAIKDGNDGVVYLNIYDPYLADNYGVFDAGLIKSAISNKQDIITNTPGFSTADKNIYHHIDKNKTLNDVKDYIEDYITNKFVKGHSYEAIRAKVKLLESYFNVVGVAVTAGKRLDFSQLHFVGDSLSRKELINRIQGEDVLTQILLLVQRINRLFPKIKINVKEDLTITQGSAYYDKDTNTIHYSPVLNRNLKSVDTQNIVEECLHPLIACIAATDNKLFLKLLAQASKDKALVSYIETAYSDKSRSIKDQEIVTQAIAGMYANDNYRLLLSIDEFQKNEARRRFKGFISAILEWINNIKKLILGDKMLVKNKDFSNIISSLESLVDILNTPKIEFIEVDSSFMSLNMQHLNSNESALSAYEIAEKIDTEREQYINDIVQQYQANNQEATQEKIASIKNQARIQFNKNKLAEIKALSGRDEVYDIIVAALSTDDLQNAEGIQSILDRINGESETSIYLTDKDKDVFRQIKEGTKVRLKSQLSRVVKRTKLIDDLKQILAIIDGKNEDSIDDVFDVIRDFLIRAEDEIEKTTKFVTEELGEDLSTWDPKQINYIKQDLIGYYEGLLKSLKDLFSGNSAVREMNKIRMEDPNQPDLQHLVDKLYHDLTDLLQYYQSRVVMPYAEKILVDFVNDSDIIEDKEQFIKNMKTWLYQDTAYGDINASEVVIGMASRSKSPIVRIIEKMMSDTEFERNRQVLKKGRELIALYNKIRPVGSQISFSNFLKMFMELDGDGGTDGKPTGYWVRDRNYGKFYKDKDEFETLLRDKYKDKGLTWKINDYSGNIELIFPDEDHKADNSVYNQYYDELDEWLDKHCERRYKLEYYKKKRRILSPEALLAQQLIQHLIDILCLKAIDEDGWVDSNKLTPHERQKLESLKKQKKELACPYIFRTNSKGIVTLEEKVGPDAEIAKQISDWNEYISKRVTYKPNKEKFEKALNKYPKGSVERRIFQRDNYIRKINPELYEAMEFWDNTMFLSRGKEYDDLKRRYRAIISHLKNYEGFAAHNLDLIGTGINEDVTVWQELLKIEQRMADIRKELYVPAAKDDEEIPEFLTSYMVMSLKEDKTFYNYLRGLWVSETGMSTKEAEDLFNRLFTYTDRKGVIRALKAFSYMGPVAETFKIDPNDKSEAEKPSYVYEYSSQFYELDEASDLVNDRWDKQLHSSLQPKVGGSIDYTNHRFKLIMSNDGYKQFYELLISTMNEANEMIPQRAVERNYLMPQITARGMQSLGRVRSFLDLLTSLGYVFLDVFTPKFAEKDGDVSTNWDLPRRPDGTVVNNIPIRFVKRLDQPELITSDVIGAVIMYYNMAVNYKLKSENLPSIELMREAINPEKSTGSHKLQKLYNKVNNMLDFRYYGKEDVIGDTSLAPSELNKAMTNIGKKFRKLASLSMLAINFTTIEVGYIDAFLSALADSVGGKYFTKQDLMYGYGLALKHLPNIIANIGNPDTKDWMVCAMQYNNLSKSNSEIFERTDQSRFRKALNQVKMGGYTMADYLINTMILGATYNHYRLVDTPDGKSKKFMSKSDAIREFTKIGYTEQEAINKWNSSKVTLRQAYVVKDGYLTAKEEYAPYINKKLENQIAGRLRDRTAVYNGVIPAVEKAKIQQNVWGSYLTLMRNFYVNTFWERAATGYDTASSEEIASSKFGMRSADSAGFVNFETGESGNGLWWSFLKGMYKYVSNVKRMIEGKDIRQLTYDQKYAVKRIMAEIVMISISAWLMVTSIAFARSNDYDDDKDPTWTINLFDPEGEDRGLLEFNGNNYDKKFTNWFRWKVALLATRTFTERSTFYWPGTVTELISSPSTAKSYLDDLGYNLELFMDLFEINGHNRSETIKSGGYRGMTRGTRDVLKITGFTGIDNIVRGWHTSGIKSTLNWYNQVTPNNFLIPSKKVWMEQQGLTKSKETKKKKKIAY